MPLLFKNAMQKGRISTDGMAPVLLLSRSAAMSDTILHRESVLDTTPTTTPYAGDLHPEVKKRLAGHEQLVNSICALVRQEARDRGLALSTIDIRPAWSHESDEQTGVIIDVEVKATTDERFSYWDGVSERTHQLDASLSPEEKQFLNDDVSLVVSRS
jgi:hypothetical protein